MNGQYLDAGDGSTVPTIRLPDDKWQRYNAGVQYLLDHRGEIEVGTLLTIIGQAMHVTELHPEIKHGVIPLSRWTGALNRMCKQCPRAWRDVMNRRTRVPAILKKLLYEIWSGLSNEPRPCTRFLLIPADAEWRICSDVCPRGLGTAKIRMPCRSEVAWWYAVSIPVGHPLGRECSTFFELFALVLFVIECLPEHIRVLAWEGDNKGALEAVRAYKAGAVYGDLMYLLATECKRRDLVILPTYRNTDVIIADPLSRRHTAGWMNDFKLRLKAAKLSSRGIEQRERPAPAWEKLYQRCLAIRTKYRPTEPQYRHSLGAGFRSG